MRLYSSIALGISNTPNLCPVKSMTRKGKKVRILTQVAISQRRGFLILPVLQFSAPTLWNLKKRVLEHIEEMFEEASKNLGEPVPMNESKDRYTILKGI